MGQTYEYRAGAKVVAIFDIVLAVINVTVVFLCFVCAIYVSRTDVELPDFRRVPILNQYAATGLNAQTVAIALWIFTIFFGICVLFSTTAAFKLLNATRIGAHPGEALSQAKFWWIVTVVLVSLEGLYYVVSMALLTLVILLIIRGFCLYVVSKYITELEAAKVKMESGVQYQIPSQGNNFVPPSAFVYEV